MDTVNTELLSSNREKLALRVAEIMDEVKKLKEKRDYLIEKDLISLMEEFKTAFRNSLQQQDVIFGDKLIMTTTARLNILLLGKFQNELRTVFPAAVVGVINSHSISSAPAIISITHLN